MALKPYKCFKGDLEAFISKARTNILIKFLSLFLSLKNNLICFLVKALKCKY